MTILGKNINIAVVAILSLLAITLTGCGGGGGGGANTDPVANAGPDQNVMAGWTVTLDGSKSSNASTYSWSLTTPAGSTATLSSTTVSRPTFTADTAGTYTLSLVVSDGKVNSPADTVTIKAVYTRAVPDTGQTASYTTTTGEDHDYLISAPSYTDNNNDGTITDNVTGLMWQKCTSWLTGSLCSGPTLTAYNWYQATGTVNATYNPGGATNACGNLSLAGHDDWRLPTDFELMSIVDYGTLASRATNTNYFPGTQSDYYWVSTGSVLNSTQAWSVEFSYSGGTVSTGPKASVSPWGMVRCVRGEQSAPVLTDNGDGTVTDEVTGLMWQKQAEAAKMTWEQALVHCEGLELPTGVTDWRLPNVKELRSIADTTKYGPSINTAYFPGTKTDYYWSSTSVVGNPGSYAWTVSFNSGSVDNTVNKTSQYYARCVRSLP